MSSVTREDIRSTVRDFILAEFLPDEDPSQLGDATPLITGGIMDSISTVRLVTHLEAQYEVVFGQGDVTVGKLDTVDLIVQTVGDKLER